MLPLFDIPPPEGNGFPEPTSQRDYKTVRASTAIALTSFGPLGSYTAFTRSHGQAVVRHHAAHVQILDHDRLVFTNETGTKLVQIVAANIRNLLVHLGHSQTRLTPVSGASLLASSSGVNSARTRSFPKARAHRNATTLLAISPETPTTAPMPPPFQVKRRRKPRGAHFAVRRARLWRRAGK